MIQSSVALSDLRLASEAPPELGLTVRKASDNEKSLATLIASIKSVGLLHPLTVKEHGGVLYVVGGNRRLTALRKLRGDIVSVSDVAPVSVQILEPGDNAREIAVMTNIALPPHPVDQFEVLSGFIDDGMSSDDLAQRWGLTPKRVDQIRSIAKLSPAVRDAWRAGDIGALTAQALTLSDDYKQQEKVLADVSRRTNGDDHGMAHSVRHMIVGMKDDHGAALSFVGMDLYKARGGTVKEDLFGSTHRVSDAKLLQSMVDERLDREIEALLAIGWKWASLPTENQYLFTKSEPGKRKPTPEDKAALAKAKKDDDWHLQTEIKDEIDRYSYTEDERSKLGCFVSMSREGGLVRKCGLQAPQAARAEKAKVKAKAEKKRVEAGEAPMMSNALMQRLSQWLTQAAAVALCQQPKLAIAAVLAGAASHEAVTITHRGLEMKKGQGTKLVPFNAMFHQTLKLPPAEQLNTLAKLAGEALDFEVFRSDQLPMKTEAVATLCNAIDGKIMNKSLLDAFDRSDYFQSGGRKAIMAALNDMPLSPDAIKAAAKMKKEEAVGCAVDHAKRTGWLPPELRVETYSGPGANKTPAAKPKAKAKKAGKR